MIHFSLVLSAGPVQQMDGAVFVRTAYHPEPILPLIEACARGTGWMGRSP